MSTTSASPSTPATPPSRWARAVQGDPEALLELAGSYWYCAYVWWRRAGLDSEQAAAATVASFTHWVTKSPPKTEDSAAELMRAWLPARLGELAVQGWDFDEEPALAIEVEWAETRYAGEPEGDPDAVFNRRWALTVLEFAMQALRAEYAARGLETLFGEVAPFVGFDAGDEARYAAAAERLGMTAGGAHKAVFDFRTQHHDLLRSMVADTVAAPADLDGEITALLCACEVPAAPDASPAPLPTAIRTFKPDELLARALNTVHMTSGGLGKWKPPSDADIARLFPQYEMLGLIGRGGMGAVYRARQVTLDREVAIKLLPLEVSVNPAFADRFVREARAMAKLSHPNIITVFEFGTTGEGHLFFAMEYVEGANLSEMIRGPGLAPAQALVVAGQVCTALAYAHGKGVIHRDIKPANVMVDTEGKAKVADFGLARLTGSDPEQFGHTVTGTVMGTPEYMAPEQKRGMAVDHRADIYSMGVMLYEMLCKEPPQGAFEPPSQRVGCDAGIDQIVLKAMHRMPEGRYQSTVEMKTDLDAAWQRQAAGTPLPTAPQRSSPAPRKHAGGSTPPYVPPPKKSSAGLMVTLLVVVLLVVGALYFLNDNQQQAAKLAAATLQAQKSAGLSTPVPELFGPPIPPGFKAPEAMPETVPPKENPPMPQAPPLAGPKDLLAYVDVARDGRMGQWQMTPEGLLTNENPGGEPLQLLNFNFAPPEEYDFEIEFTIKGGVRELSQVLAVPAHSILWKMGFGDGLNPTFFSFGDLLDGRPASTSGRTEAVVRWPRLKLNQRYRTMVEVRRDSLRALLDGEEVLRWSGDVTRLAADEKFLLKDRRELGVVAWGSTILFHKATVRPPGIASLPPPPKSRAPETPNVAAAPAASALVAASNDPRLVKLEAAFKARFDSDGQKPYLASIAALNQSYIVNGLARARPAAQAKGSLDEITALDAEKDAIGKGVGVPQTDEPGTPDSLKTLRAQYRAAMAKYNADRAKAGAQLYDIYLAALDSYVVELTRANKIDDAKKMKAMREEVAAKKAELAQPGVTDPPKAGAATADLKAPNGGSVREVAKWLLTMGGKCTVAKGTLETDVLSEREIPPGKFDITGLTLDRRDAKLPAPADTDFQFLRGLKSLRTVFLNMTGYGDAALAFLADDADLTAVQFYGPSNLTDAALSPIADARKITEITLTLAPNFTGKGLEKMHWLPVLTRADFSSSGLTDEGLKGLLAARRLQSLNLKGTKVTPASVEAFKKVVPKCVVNE